MEQIVEYKDIKTLSDITKTFASIPMGVTQDENGVVKFTISNFDEFKERISKLLKEDYDGDFIITDKNVATYEKEASELNKLMKQVKSDASDFVNNFAIDLVGITRGKKRRDGQVQEIEKLIKPYYDKIHEKTKEFRENARRLEAQENAIEGEIVEEKSKTTIYMVEVPNEIVSRFEDFCLKNKIILK